MNPPNFTFDKKSLLDILFLSEKKLSPQAYTKKISTTLAVSVKKARAILKSLVDQGDLSYEYEYGATYVTQSFSKPVRVTDSFVLIPAGQSLPENQNNLNIIIEPGISFGSGRHPTTRLCLEAVETVFIKEDLLCGDTQHHGADIGTGSGVLAIAMCLAGLASCKAYDVDANCISEARRNVGFNNLENKIEIIGSEMEAGNQPYSVIIANLRFPTLKSLSRMFLSSLAPEGILIMSGIRSWEKEDLVMSYSKIGCSPVWEKDEKNWSSVVLKHTG